MVCQAGCDPWRTTSRQQLPDLSQPQATVWARGSFGMGLARSCALTAVSHLLAKGLRRTEQTVRQQRRAWDDDTPRKRGAKHSTSRPAVRPCGAGRCACWPLVAWRRPGCCDASHAGAGIRVCASTQAAACGPLGRRGGAPCRPWRRGRARAGAARASP